VARLAIVRGLLLDAQHGWRLPGSFPMAAE
jgi:hypothetical protein